MTNTYYNPTGAPASGTRGLSLSIRNELAAIEDGFDELETAFSTNGLVFPATQVPSSNANTLDDYEEGLALTSWVPTGGSGVVLTNAYGQYIKVGRLVFVQCEFTYPVSALSTVAGIGGLPFAAVGPSTGSASFSLGQVTGGSFNFKLVLLINGNSLLITRPGATRATQADMSGKSFKISGVYIATA